MQRLGFSFIITLFFSIQSFAQDATSSNTTTASSATAQVVAPVVVPGTGAYYSKRLDIYLSTFINALGKDAPFVCPGDSVLVGMITEYHNDVYDRLFKFVCSFMEDNKGNLLAVSAPSNDPRADNIINGDASSVCAGSGNVLNGLNSLWDTKNNAGSKDRHFYSKCTQLKNLTTQQALQIDASHCTDSSFTGINFDFTYACENNQVLTKIRSKYQGKDRMYSFTCCSLK